MLTTKRKCNTVFGELSGILKGENGQALKSCEKPLLQEREIAVYEAIKNSDDPVYKELALLAPKYMGTMESTYKNRRTHSNCSH